MAYRRCPGRTRRPGAHVARACMTYLHSQAEAGSGCPLTMTFACVPALRLQPDVAQTWLPKVLAPTTTRATSASAQKAGVTWAWP
jgi:putative acyl-CoA dehydrogenase